MVLEDASASQSSFSENIPTSDVDPYARSNPEYAAGTNPNYLLVSNSGLNPVYVDLNKIPRPFSFIGAKEHPKPLQNAIKETCNSVQPLIHRPVTQEEAEALAFYIGKSISIASYGTPVGVALATVQCYRRQKEYRFPGWSPMKEGSNLSPDRFGPLRGSMARSAWQVSRLSCYWIVGGLLGQLFFASYALSVGTTGRFQDRRLKELNHLAANRMKENRGNRLPQRATDESDGPRREETFEMARQRRSAQDAWKSRGQQEGPSRKPKDDMSPTDGALADEFSSWKEDGFVDDTAAQPRELSQQKSYSGVSDNSWRQSEYGGMLSSSTSPQVGRTSSQQRQLTSAPSKEGNGESSTKPRQAVSSWEQLRQNAMAGRADQSSAAPTSQGQAETGRSNASSPFGDSFSFSQGDRDQQLARSDAQKDFDSRVEREREGRDFDDKRGAWRK